MVQAGVDLGLEVRRPTDCAQLPEMNISDKIKYLLLESADWDGDTLKLKIILSTLSENY